MATVLFFAAARQATGVSRQDVDALDVEAAVSQLRALHGDALDRLLPYCTVMVNGEACTPQSPLGADSELAILPPVAGG